jgi:2-polyprenyl-3-methyl-5-hydroxy-6-metoxy-1,4-benzoquinol methylase
MKPPAFWEQLEPKERFNEDYFENGVTTGISGYENYRWIPELTIPAAMTTIDLMAIRPHDRVLDFGCAKGYMVKALRWLQRDAWGCDVSEYAIRNADNEVYQYISKCSEYNVIPWERGYFDVILAKDVLEHLTDDQIRNFSLACRLQDPRGIFLTIPLAKNGKYIIPSCELDVTHIQRRSLEQWEWMFEGFGWTVESTTKVPGLKSPDNGGVGFFILTP